MSLPAIITIDNHLWLLRSFDFTYGNLQLSVTLPSKPNALALAPSGEKIAVATEENTLLLDPATFETLCTLESGEAACVAFSPSSEYLSVGCYDGCICPFGMAAHDMISSSQEGLNRVCSTAFSPSGGLLVYGFGRHAVAIYRVPSMMKVQVLQAHTAEVSSVLFLTESTLATASFDSNIAVWGVHSGACLKEIPGHTDFVYSLNLSPDRSRFVSSCYDGTVKIFDAATFECVKQLTFESALWYACFAGDGTLLIGMDESDLIAVLADTGDVVSRYAHHMFTFGIVLYEGLGKLLVSLLLLLLMQVFLLNDNLILLLFPLAPQRLTLDAVII